MATSQNGWPVLWAGDPHLHKWLLPGTNRYFLLRNGCAGFLLAHYALFFHRKIERLDLGVWDDWGWAVRPIAGQLTGYSNHASATAVDLNSIRHPLGVPASNTFTKDQVDLIHKRLDVVYDHTLRWGGDYNGRPDAMHTEVNVPVEAANVAAIRLLDSPLGEDLLAANPGQKRVILS